MNRNAVINVMISVNNPCIFLVHHQTMLSWVPVLTTVPNHVLLGLIFITYQAGPSLNNLPNKNRKTAVLNDIWFGSGDECASYCVDEKRW